MFPLDYAVALGLTGVAHKIHGTSDHKKRDLYGKKFIAALEGLRERAAMSK